LILPESKKIHPVEFSASAATAQSLRIHARIIASLAACSLLLEIAAEQAMREVE
jgi:hypothetical protein